MPVYTEIMSLLGFKSKNAASKLVHKLIEEGVLDKDSTGRVIPNKLIGEVPVLGLVEAGFPTVAEEVDLDTMNIDDYLIRYKDATYMLEVKGDSMIEAGINEGDLVIAERIGGEGSVREAKDGDIVIADVDGAARSIGGPVWGAHHGPGVKLERYDVAGRAGLIKCQRGGDRSL